MKIFYQIMIIVCIFTFCYSCGTSSSNTDEIDTDKFYKIVSVHSGKCLDIGSKDDGTGVFQCTCNNSDKQKFKFVEDLNDLGVYFIINKFSNKNIDIAGGTKDDGGKVIQWTPNNGENQKFSLLSVADNKFNIISKNSGKLLDVTGASKNDSVPLVQWSANGQENQVFEFVTIEE